MSDVGEAFSSKAGESLDGAASEFVNGRYNNAANRSYYACFQAAIAALDRAGIRPASARAEWGHAFVQAEFVGQLINRRKIYPAELRRVLSQTLSLREQADYRLTPVSEPQAARALARARLFVAAVAGQGGTTDEQRTR